MPSIEQEKFLESHVEDASIAVIHIKASSYIRKQTGDGFPEDIRRQNSSYLRSVFDRAREHGSVDILEKEVKRRVFQLTGE